MKILCYVFFVTAVALVYIHLQMNIIDLAYRGKAKEQKIRHLIEENGNEIYTILTLKSANHLGENILGKDSDLRFIDQDNVLELSFTEPSASARTKAAKPAGDGRQVSFLSFLSVGD